MAAFKAAILEHVIVAAPASIAQEICYPDNIGMLVLMLAKGTKALELIILPPVLIVNEYWAVEIDGKLFDINPK